MSQILERAGVQRLDLSRPIVRRATEDDLPRVAITLAAAFEHDPVAKWVVTDKARRFQVMRAFFQAGLHSLWWQHRLVYLADEGAAACVWLPPGQVQPTPEEMAGAAPDFEAAFGEFAPGFATLAAIMEKAHPHQPHYYLPFVGVQPIQQGRGLGSAVLEPMLVRADAEGMPAYLEATTARSRDLYARHGFEVVGLLELPGGLTMYPMWRDSR